MLLDSEAEEFNLFRGASVGKAEADCHSVLAPFANSSAESSSGPRFWWQMPANWFYSGNQTICPCGSCTRALQSG